MKKYFRYQLSWLVVVLVTWAVIAIPRIMVNTEHGFTALATIEVVIHTLMLLRLLLVINEQEQSYGYPVRYVLLVVIGAGIIGLQLLTSATLILIYMVMFSAILVYYLPLRYCYLSIAVNAVLFLLLQRFYWHHPWPVLNTLSTSAFCLFALVVSQRTMAEQQAKEALQISNASLQTTQALLIQAGASEERLHLARELHDDVGHQLTSLIMQLDIARRTASDTLKPQLEHCYQHARQTLASVRSVVSDKRNHSPIDLQPTLMQLAENTPRIAVVVHYQAHPLLAQLNYAQCVLRCAQEGISNALKHSLATELHIHLYNHNPLRLTISDNGSHLHNPVPGNGLLGLKERVETLGGTFTFTPNSKGMVLNAEFPYANDSH